MKLGQPRLSDGPHVFPKLSWLGVGLSNLHLTLREPALPIRALRANGPSSSCATGGSIVARSIGRKRFLISYITFPVPHEEIQENAV